MDVQYVSTVRVADLKPHPSNSRLHSKEQIEKLVTCIRQFGFLAPVITSADNTVLAGHARLLAAQELGLDTIPAVSADHLNAAQQRAFMLADNKLAELAEWNEEVLAIELKELSDIVFDFSVEDLGFETAEIDMMIERQNNQNADDFIPEVQQDRPAVTHVSDLWVLGNHLLYCGNALQEDSYDVLMKEQWAQMVFTDPPYNVPIQGHAGNKGKIKHREFAMAAGEMSELAFTNFLADAHKLMASHTVNGGIIFSCMDWRHLDELLAAVLVNGLELKNVCIWVKPNGGMGSLYRSRHEMVFVLKNGTGKHINNVQLGKHGRNRTNVWEYAGVNSFGNRQEELELHPTVKPTEMVADAIRDCSRRNGIILDPFGGSGTTLIAAEKTGRRARLIELDPLYCDVIVRRWQRLTGKEAVDAGSGKTFNELVGGRND